MYNQRPKRPPHRPPASMDTNGLCSPSTTTWRKHLYTRSRRRAQNICPHSAIKAKHMLHGPSDDRPPLAQVPHSATTPTANLNPISIFSRNAHSLHCFRTCLPARDPAVARHLLPDKQASPVTAPLIPQCEPHESISGNVTGPDFAHSTPCRIASVTGHTDEGSKFPLGGCGVAIHRCRRPCCW